MEIVIGVMIAIAAEAGLMMTAMTTMMTAGSSVTAAVAAIVGVIIIISMANKGNKSSKSKPVAPGAQRTGNLRPMSEFKELDPEFDEAVLREKLSNLYIQMQNEWHNRNIESLKPYFTDAFYNQSERQIKQKIENHQTPCTERVAVFEVTPRGFYTSGGMDHIIVCVKSRLVAYTIDDNTGQVISGDKNKEKFMEYEWDICRKSGTLTNKTDGMKTVNCPNCGAPLNINQTTKCPFCMSVINIVNEDWALNGIKGISQRTQ